MAPKNPPGPPMTLGNMRELGARTSLTAVVREVPLIYLAATIVSETSVTPENPSVLAAAGVKSIIRPRTNGPLSFIRTNVFFPFR